MAINFPNSPSNGDSFVTGGITYVWDGSSWSALGSGATTTLDANFADLEILNFGDSNDLRIYHDGVTNIITNNSGAGLEINLGSNSNSTLSIKNGIETIAKFMRSPLADGWVELYYDDVKKFETTSQGIEISGDIVCDKITVSSATASNILLDGFGVTLGVIGAGGPGSQPAELRFLGQTVADYVALRGSLSYTGQLVWTLPGVDGSAGQALTTDGSGNLGWSSISGGGGTATPAGSDTQIQFNGNGSFAARPELTLYELGGLPATIRLQVGDSPGNPSQNYIGEILADSINLQKSLSCIGDGYFGMSDNQTFTVEGFGTTPSTFNIAGTVALAIDYNTGTAGQVLTATGDDGSGNATGIVWSTPSSVSRTTAAGTTASIANNSSANLTITAAKVYTLLKIQTSAAAWVTVYTDTTSRTSDASRTSGTDALPGTGVIAEVITSGATTQLITPSVIGFNNDATPSSNVYLKVENRSGSTQAITVTLTYVPLEV